MRLHLKILWQETSCQLKSSEFPSALILTVRGSWDAPTLKTMSLWCFETVVAIDTVSAGWLPTVNTCVASWRLCDVASGLLGRPNCYKRERGCEFVSFVCIIRAFD